jgi:hypothetical protein
MPCADMEVNSPTHSSLEFASNHESHSHDKQNDLCPPFCVCNCCGAQVLTNFQGIVYDFPVISIAIETKEPFYKPVFASYFFGSIWQPPQIV